jgi:uncharacterized protein (DUF2141 family)
MKPEIRPMNTAFWGTVGGMVVGLLVLASSLGAVGNMQPSSSGNLIRVEITGARNDRGQIICALFTPGNGFPSKGESAIAHTHTGISNGSAVCEFQGVTPGRYAVSVFHDENSNGKMDTNFIGIPKEGVGASNDAKGRFGPPKFDAAAFQYPGGRLELKIRLFYL